MKNFLYLTLISIIVTSCAPGGEQSIETEDLEGFLAMVEEENKKAGTVIYSASWISSNFITYDSQ